MFFDWNNFSKLTRRHQFAFRNAQRPPTLPSVGVVHSVLCYTGGVVLEHACSTLYSWKAQTNPLDAIKPEIKHSTIRLASDSGPQPLQHQQFELLTNNLQRGFRRWLVLDQRYQFCIEHVIDAIDCLGIFRVSTKLKNLRRHFNSYMIYKLIA